MLRNFKGEVLSVFCKHVGVKESSEKEVLVILEARRVVVHTFNGKLVVGNNSFDDIAWGSSSEGAIKVSFPCK